MSKIIRLSDEVIGQIAAGEVVENPSAAIKELIENSIDAGATNIVIDIEQGGLKLIRIVDNGSGILKEDLRLAFERHATSKLRTAEELFKISTMGFRGEALASIAAVSKVKLTSKADSDSNAYSIEVEGGDIGEIRPAAIARGTSIVVKDMFFNAPVRQKFMKQPKMETSRVSDIVKQAILANPNVSFRFKADGNSIYFSNGDSKLESAALSIYGLSSLKQLRKVDYTSLGISVSGFVGVGDLSRGNRQHQNFFVNGRMMRSQLISKALEDACHQRVMIGRFPMCILYITMPYNTVDVNVHPNKWEVRFLDEKSLREVIFEAIREALTEGLMERVPPELFFERDANKNIEAKVDALDSLKAEDEALASGFKTGENESKTAGPSLFVSESNIRQGDVLILNDEAASVMAGENKEKQIYSDKNAENHEHTSERLSNLEKSSANQDYLPKNADNEQKDLENALFLGENRQEAIIDEQFLRKKNTELRLIGVVFNTYVLFEYDELFILCDQHAMHERLLFERLMTMYEQGALTQLLLVPELVDLSFQEYQCFLNNQALLAECGFDAEDFGNGIVRLHGLPMILGVPEAKESFRAAIDELLESSGINNKKHFDKILMSACKHAIKGGDEVPMQELINLTKNIIDKKLTPTCPHGRPLMISLTKRELEKRFGRIQL